MTSAQDRPGASPAVPATIVSGRSHGSLNAITDSERRALRPIGMTAHEAAVRTGTILTGLFALPGVRIFQGVLPTAADVPRIPHVVSLGRRLLFVESVAWPPGRYVTTAAGRIHCDGVYIGQSVRPLIAAVRYWEILLDRHWVSALVIVHPIATGELALPAAAGQTLAWVHPDDAVGHICAHLDGEPQTISVRAVAALAAATAEDCTCRDGEPPP